MEFFSYFHDMDWSCEFEENISHHSKALLSAFLTLLFIVSLILPKEKIYSVAAFASAVFLEILTINLSALFQFLYAMFHAGSAKGYLHGFSMFLAAMTATNIGSLLLMK